MIVADLPSKEVIIVIVKQKVANLKVNPLKNEIYRDEDVEDLKQSITSNGMKILVPIVVTPDGVIISGHRRYKAAIELNIKEVNTIIEDVKTEDMGFRMIQYNISRRKKYSEILNEMDILCEYYWHQKGKKKNLTEKETMEFLTHISNMIGLPIRILSVLRTIRKCEPDYITLIDDGKTTITRAFEKCKRNIGNDRMNNPY